MQNSKLHILKSYLEQRKAFLHEDVANNAFDRGYHAGQLKMFLEIYDIWKILTTFEDLRNRE
jgi:hypothetical protein